MRILVTKIVGPEFNQRFRIANKGEILDGSIDSDGNFSYKNGERDITIYPSHFKILGKFYYRKDKG